MPMTAADRLVETLSRWGVEVIFGMPGDGINGIMEALRQRQDRIRFIQVRHEEAAAFMACGWAKFTGKLGCCLATTGPGGIHLLNGLYDAKLDKQPVLAITGLPFHDLIGTFTQQDVELDKLFQDVAVFNQRIMGPQHVENVTELACRTALSYRGVAHLTFPVDFQSQPMPEDKPSMRNVPGHVSHTFASSIPVPTQEDLQRAAEALNTGKKVAILCGRGALGATNELEQIADLLGAPIVKALLGKTAVPDDSPYTTGGIGLLGSEPSQAAMEECDTLLLIGTSFPYIEYYPKPGQARCVQIDADPMRISLRYPVGVGLVGDSKATLRQLLPLLRRKEDRNFLEQSQTRMKEWRLLMERRGTCPDKPMKPQVVAWELGKRLRDDAILCADSGTNTVWWARQIPAKRGQMHSVSGLLASMACGLPYAIAAQIAYPERQVVAFVGDGGFAMLMAEFVTCVKYNLPIKVIIVNNHALGMIRWEQIIYQGNPEYGIELQNIDYAAIARACGATGFRIEDPAQCSQVLEEALAHPGPVVVDALVDTLEPPTPPKVTEEEARKFQQAMEKGQPYKEKIALTALGDKVRQLT
jgi:pyruvate dehydrogenase (quinone)